MNQGDLYMVTQVSAMAQVAALGAALGEALIAGDLAALVAHKRQASLRRESAASLASAVSGPLDIPDVDSGCSLEAHRSAYKFMNAALSGCD